jgi:hypothetical protein
MVMLCVVVRMERNNLMNRGLTYGNNAVWPNARASVISSHYGAMKGFNRNKGWGREGVN